MDRLPIVFLGSPRPAATVLTRLLDNGHAVLHVVTGVDKRRGRGSSVSPTPVKEVALQRGIAVSHDLSWLESAEARRCLAVVVAYGRIIPAHLVESMVMINVHFSLLPRWRGAAPVERAIIAGDDRTGVSLMRMDAGLDTGPVYGEYETPISVDETSDELVQRLADLGAEGLVELLDSTLPEPKPQVGEATYASKIRPDEHEIRWDEPADLISRKTRALRTHTRLHGRRVRIVRTQVVSMEGSASTIPVGTITPECVVQTGKGWLRLDLVQSEGRPVTTAVEWLRGIRDPHPIFEWSTSEP